LTDRGTYFLHKTSFPAPYSTQTDRTSLYCLINSVVVYDTCGTVRYVRYECCRTYELTIFKLLKFIQQAFHACLLQNTAQNNPHCRLFPAPHHARSKWSVLAQNFSRIILYRNNIIGNENAIANADKHDPPFENLILVSNQSYHTVPYVPYRTIVRRTMWVRTCVRDNTANKEPQSLREWMVKVRAKRGKGELIEIEWSCLDARS